MQPNLSDETPALDQEPATKKCITCGSEAILPGYPNALCAGCRESYLKFPFPLWIKAFGICIGLVVIFSLFSFIGHLQTGIHMARGEKAEHDHLYLTAQHEFEQVLKKAPEHTEAWAHLLIGAYYNQDLQTLAKAANALQGKKFDNDELYVKTDYVMNESSQFFPSDSVSALLEKYKDDTGKIKDAVMEDYYRNNHSDVFAGLKIASDALYNEAYVKADTTLKKIIAEDPESISAITLMSSVKRYQKDAAGALTYINQLLALNKENLYALSSKARVMLMMRKDDEALKLAKNAEKLDKTFAYNTATLAIIYHYTHKTKERDEVINAAKTSKDSTAMEYMQYALDIINNKEKLRD